jgi:hypothetical protein
VSNVWNTTLVVTSEGVVDTAINALQRRLSGVIQTAVSDLLTGVVVEHVIIDATSAGNVIRAIHIVECAIGDGRQRKALIVICEVKVCLATLTSA